MNPVFGTHMMLDIHTDSDQLNTGVFWRTLLVDLVREIGMTPISKPMIHSSTCENKSWIPPVATGLSGFIVLAESHIAFHTFVEAGYVFLDVFSCKHFEKMKVWEFLKERLEGVEGDMHLATRGANFPMKH